MADVFAAVAGALAALLGTTNDVAGYILGFMVLIVFLVGLVLIFGTEALNGKAAILLIGFPIVFVALVDWWPKWTLLFIAVLILAAWTFRE